MKDMSIKKSCSEQNKVCGPEPIPAAVEGDHKHGHVQGKQNAASLRDDERSRRQLYCNGQKQPCDEACSGDDAGVVPDSKKPNLGNGLVQVEQSHDEPREEELGRERTKVSQADGAVVSGVHNAEPQLEIVIQCEAFTGEDDNLIFDHTQLVLKRGTDYFHAILKDRESKLKDLDIGSLDLALIPREHFCPLLKQGITVAPEPSTNIYVKRPCLIHWYPSDENPESIGGLVLQEAEICEILKKHPHPNIVRYFGCIVENSRIIGLCLAKCTSKLSDKLADSTLDERKMYCEGIEKGVRHLHQLGLIHNDLNPNNLMMNGNTPVIIDFDSCRPKGEKMGIKKGTFGWSDEKAEVATPENDFYSLEKVKQYIMKGGKVEQERFR